MTDTKVMNRPVSEPLFVQPATEPVVQTVLQPTEIQPPVADAQPIMQQTVEIKLVEPQPVVDNAWVPGRMRLTVFLLIVVLVALFLGFLMRL